MSHKPISFHNIGLSFPQKVCFEGLTIQVLFGSCIAFMGLLQNYKGTLIVVSHDEDFLKKILIETYYTITHKEVK